MEQIIHKCIDSQPDRRYQSVMELIAAVEALDTTVTSEAPA